MQHNNYNYDRQMDWYEWVIDGITKQNNEKDTKDNYIAPEHLLYIHIPLCEYRDAYKA